MVWQEFMFACAYYPDEPWYHAMVREEAAQQIKRLRNHPCKVIWCGNNECDWLHWEFWHEETPVFHGEKIYHELLPAQVKQHEPGAIYVPSSPIATPRLRRVFWGKGVLGDTPSPSAGEFPCTPFANSAESW